LYALQEDELDVEGGEYSEIDVIYDDNEIDECWKQFYDFV